MGYFSDRKVSDVTYDDTWDGDATHAPSKGALRDKFVEIEAALVALQTIDGM